MDPALDLTLERLIRAPRTSVWKAWTDPALLARWWTPAPTRTRVDVLDARPGGGFVTSMSEDGRAFTPHTDAVFIAVEEGSRLVFTNAIDSTWRPAAPAPVPMTAQVTLRDHPEGTEYLVLVRHGTPADRAHHHELGFFDGWGSVTDALTRLAEGQVTR
ncbi:SRPBCC domain-containing protein [Kineococcus sp. SYSU DK002]|uniref:SRPBCC domain-containing protein n=1 Tax=Kineococcus sp. SYSU DK002 TaxID=3383123 RepID=UPI003D7CE4A3